MYIYLCLTFKSLSTYQYYLFSELMAVYVLAYVSGLDLLIWTLHLLRFQKRRQTLKHRPDVNFCLLCNYRFWLLLFLRR